MTICHTCNWQPGTRVTGRYAVVKARRLGDDAIIIPGDSERLQHSQDLPVTGVPGCMLQLTLIAACMGAIVWCTKPSRRTRASFNRQAIAPLQAALLVVLSTAPVSS